MHIVLGGTGHVGSALATALLDRAEAVTIVVRDAGKAEALRIKGAEVAITDVRDIDSLRQVLRHGTRAFLLNPPADPASDTDAEERASVSAIVAALDGSGLEMVVAESTYGAQPGERIGDLTVLHEFEKKLEAQPVPASIIRAAYYMSNWEAMLPGVRDEGVLPTLYPAGVKIPMVAAADIAEMAADLMIRPVEGGGTRHVEGPERYSSNDVAAAFAAALGRPVTVSVTPREGWESAYRELGFSRSAAASYARMTAVSVDGDYPMPDAPIRGSTSLQHYIADLVGS